MNNNNNLNSNDDNNLYRDYMNKNDISNINNQLKTINQEDNGNINQQIYYQSSNREARKQKVYKILSLIFFILIVISLGGFALVYTGVIKYNQISPKSLLLNIGNIGLKSGKEYQYEYQIYPENTTSKHVYFESSDPDVVDVNPITGYITGKKEGVAYITVKSETDNSVIEQSIVTITDETIPVTNITLSSKRLIFDLSSSNSKLLKLSTEPVDATERKFDFYSSDENVAIVDSNGKVSPVGFGMAVITVSTKDGSVKAECEVIVTDSENKRVYFETPNKEKLVYPYSIELEYNYLNLNIGSSRKVGFTLLPPDVTEDVVTWISANPQVASVKDGVITGNGLGHATITAITINDLVATLEVDVIADSIEPTILSFKEEQEVLDLYETKKLDILYDQVATNNNFTYESNNTNVVIVDNQGNIKGINSGEAVVTVKYGNLSDTIKVTVTKNDNISNILSTDETKISIKSGESKQIIVYDENGLSDNINYRSNDSSIATVNERGLVLAKGIGQTTIIASNAKGAVIEINVTVTGIESTRIVIESDQKSIKVGESLRLVANVYPNLTTDKKVIWSSSNKNILIVSEDGVIKGIKAGKAKVRATLDDLYSEIEIEVVNKNSTTNNTTVTTQKENLNKTEIENISKNAEVDTQVVGNEVKLNFDSIKYGLDDSKIKNIEYTIEKNEVNAKLENNTLKLTGLNEGLVSFTTKITLENGNIIKLLEQNIEVKKTNDEDQVEIITEEEQNNQSDVNTYTKATMTLNVGDVDVSPSCPEDWKRVSKDVLGKPRTLDWYYGDVLKLEAINACNSSRTCEEVFLCESGNLELTVKVNGESKRQIEISPSSGSINCSERLKFTVKYLDNGPNLSNLNYKAVCSDGISETSELPIIYLNDFTQNQIKTDACSPGDILTLTVTISENDIRKYRYHIVGDEGKWIEEELYRLSTGNDVKTLVEFFDKGSGRFQTNEEKAKKYYIFNSSNPSIATVDNSGTVKGEKEGVSTITVTSKETGKIVKKYTFMIYNKEPTSTAYTDIKLKNTSTTIYVGDSRTYLSLSEGITLYNKDTKESFYVYRPSNLFDFKSSDPDMVRVTVTGAIDLTKNAKPGTVKITIKYKENPSLTADFYVRIVERKLNEYTNIKLNSYQKSLNIKDSYSIIIDASNDDGKTYKTIDNSNNSTYFKFNSSNSNVATVDANGKIVAREAGNAVITVSSKKNSKISKTISVSVKDPTIQSSYTCYYYQKISSTTYTCDDSSYTLKIGTRCHKPLSSSTNRSCRTSGAKCKLDNSTGKYYNENDYKNATKKINYGSRAFTSGKSQANANKFIATCTCTVKCNIAKSGNCKCSK